MDVDVRPCGDQGDELGAGGGAPVDAGGGPYQGGCRDAVPPGVHRRRETTEEMQAGGGGRRDNKDYLGHGHGGEGASDPTHQPNVARAGQLRLPGRDHPKATGAAMCE